MIIRKILLVAACLPFTAGLSGCDPFAIQGNGEVTSVTRSVAAFTEVDAESSLDVEIRQGRAFAVELRLDKNLVSHVTTRVEDGRLVIESDRDLATSVDGPEIVVTMPELSRAVLGGSGVLSIPSWDSDEPIVFVLSGSGDLQFDGDAPEVTANVGGSGDASLKGRAESVDLTLTGSGDLDAKAMPAARATVRLSGSGDVSANVDGPVDVSLSGSGGVDLFGRPRIEQKSRSGSGDVTIHH